MGDTSFLDTSDEFLEHYGRKGMKWYQHVFGEDKTYSKAISKLQSLNSRVGKSEKKVSRLQGETLTRQAAANNALLFKKSKAKRAAKSTRKLAKEYLKVQRRTEKAKKWYDAMESVFKDTKINELRNTELGKKYAEMTIDDMMSNISSSAAFTQLAAYYESKSRR